jgi:hypothetical protein
MQFGAHMNKVAFSPQWKHLHSVISFVVFGIICRLCTLWLPAAGVSNILGVGSSGTAELHNLSPLAETFVETMIERDEKWLRQKNIQCGV